MPLTTAERAQLAASIDRDGWAVTPPVVPQLEIDRLLDELAPLAAAADDRGGVRNLLDASNAARVLAASPAVRSIAESVLGPHCFAVRAILFDKTPAANWKVVWHQDLTIAVRERAPGNVPGFGPWSEKAGVVHVQPPAELLERMLAVRVHLDDCGASNGPVRVISGSHRVGRLSSSAIDACRDGAAAVDCLAERGAVLAFRPLILHASSPAATPAHRRVVHIEFAADELPEPLEWHSRVA
ncbi:MAG TPA: phytanoyl-CoA dioxygenase family protein [Gemmatimonadaceae bacterium]|nr:phytanoyl-CoA dioxygenase family protein [Gemmatimonadaceae bacterium]